MDGSFPRRALAMVIEWGAEHRRESEEDWELCARNSTLKKIAPLP